MTCSKDFQMNGDDRYRKKASVFLKRLKRHYIWSRNSENLDHIHVPIVKHTMHSTKPIADTWRMSASCFLVSASKCVVVEFIQKSL